MVTESFCVDLPKDMFKMMYRDYCEAHDIKIPDRNNEEANYYFDKAIDWIWDEYSDDICAFLDGNLPEYFSDLEWDNDVGVTKAVVVMYIDYCVENPNFCVDLETYWRDLMRQAMDAQEFFFTPEREAEIWGEI